MPVLPHKLNVQTIFAILTPQNAWILGTGLKKLPKNHENSF
jgi:hypothetical protein